MEDPLVADLFRVDSESGAYLLNWMIEGRLKRVYISYSQPSYPIQIVPEILPHHIYIM